MKLLKGFFNIIINIIKFFISLVIETIKVITQYPVFKRIYDFSVIKRKLKKAYNDNYDGQGAIHIIKHAIKDIQDQLKDKIDIDVIIEELNKDDNMYNLLQITKKSNDALIIKIGLNSIIYNLKNKKIDWTNIGALIK